MEIDKVKEDKFGINKAIGITILSRIIQSIGGIVSIIFIAKYLSAVEQGYYYTFSSIIALQFFFELGLTGIITQYTAHEFAFLKWSDGHLIGDTYYTSRLSSLLRFCVKWFGVISIILFFCLFLSGTLFFQRNEYDEIVQWRGPWILLCLTTSLNLFIDPIFSFLDGLGKVEDVAGMRLFQKTTLLILMLIFFSLNLKLYSGALASLCAIVINYIQLGNKKRFNLIQKIWFANDKWKLNYRKEIFPFHWKMALGFLSGYFIYQLFSPVLFSFEGAVVAGKMGLTLTALNGVSSITMSWITTKVPLFSNYIAKKEFNKLDIVFGKSLKQLTTVSFVGLSLFVLIMVEMKIYFPEFRLRFLQDNLLIMLSLVTFTNQFIFSWSTYLRCHKQEPFLLYTIVMGILCALSTLILGKYLGLQGLVKGFTFINLFIGLPLAYYLFYKYKRILNS